LRSQQGFSLIELVIVVGIIAIVAAMAAPSLSDYLIREDTRSNAQKIAHILAEARERAIDTGLNHFVIFSNPLQFRIPGVDGAPQIAQVVRDIDGNWGFGPADRADAFYAVRNTHPNVTAYGPASPHSNATLAPEDAQATNPFFADLNAVGAGNGSTFPNAPFNFNPTVGFNTQGIPVNLNTPGVPGSGAGAFYVTDSRNAVYATVLLPLGGVHVRTLNASFAPMVWQ
jgi:prepilin-type N-terminal cleavage/methylation domain-containing protein